MQRTDVSRPREQLHAPTLQEMLEMDSEFDGGELQNYQCLHRNRLFSLLRSVEYGL